MDFLWPRILFYCVYTAYITNKQTRIICVPDDWQNMARSKTWVIWYLINVIHRYTEQFHLRVYTFLGKKGKETRSTWCVRAIIIFFLKSGSAARKLLRYLIPGTIYLRYILRKALFWQIIYKYLVCACDNCLFPEIGETKTLNNPVFFWRLHILSEWIYLGFVEGSAGRTYISGFGDNFPTPPADHSHVVSAMAHDSPKEYRALLV